MGRNVIVTGGGTGIGRAVAASFAARGDSVVITGRRPEPLQRAAATLGAGVRALACDATVPAQVHALRAQLPDTVGVLVNCAGGNTDFDRAGPDDLASLAANWRANLEANLLSAVLMTTVVADRFTEGGSVINISSIAADNGAGAYGAAKAALASWNIDLARELGPRGVTANVVSPGYIADTEFFRDHLSEQHGAGLIAATFTGRPGTRMTSPGPSPSSHRPQPARSPARSSRSTAAPTPRDNRNFRRTHSRQRSRDSPVGVREKRTPARHHYL